MILDPFRLKKSASSAREYVWRSQRIAAQLPRFMTLKDVVGVSIRVDAAGLDVAQQTSDDFWDHDNVLSSEARVPASE